MFTSFKLVGCSRTELNTEMRFLFASAKVDGAELVRLDPPICDNEKDNARVVGCVIKVLRTLKKDGIIEFYVNSDGFYANSTEASFLLNKFGEYIDEESLRNPSIFVKL